MKRLGNYRETSRKVEFTMSGWDGTGYQGEGKKMNIWVNPLKPEGIFVCRYMACYKKWCVLKICKEQLHEISGLPIAFYEDSFGKEMMKK